LPGEAREELEIEESELTELDRESCVELLEKRGVTERELQDRIVSVSGGNPFVIGAMCDVADSASLSLNEVEDLRADTLEAVRLKTWRRLFSETQDLLRLVEKAGLLPSFNRRTMTIIAPDMRTDHWDRLIRLSFVKYREDGTWVLHDLARELIIAELGPRLQDSTDEVAELLERTSNDESDYTLLGLAMSVRALVAERDAEARIGSLVFDFTFNAAYSDALTFLDAVAVRTKEGEAILRGLRGGVLTMLNRFADGEDALLSALQAFREFGEEIPDELMVHKARTLSDLGRLLQKTERTSEAIETLEKSVKIYRELDEKTLGFHIKDMAQTVMRLGWVLIIVNRLEEGEKASREAYELYRRSKTTEFYDPARSFVPGIAAALASAGKIPEAEDSLREYIRILREFASNGVDSSRLRLAICLGNLSELLSKTSRPYEAEKLCREAIHMEKEAARMKPESYLSWIPPVLNLLALPLKQTGRYSKAEEAYIEALEISRELAETTPGAFSFLAAWTLFDYAVLLRQTGRVSEAEEACREALDMHRELVTISPSKYNRLVSWNLNNLAVLLSQTNRAPEAEEAYREALVIAREIALGAPEAVLLTDLLATILNNLAVLLRKTGKTPAAEETIQEALEIRRQLAQKSPELFLHRVATTLNNLGILLLETGKTSEAEDALREALQLRRDLLGESPDLYQPGVGSTLNNLGILLKRSGRFRESQDAYCEAIDIGENLVSRAPAVFQYELGRTLCNYALLLSDTDSTDTLQKTMSRLKELGIESLPESERWSEEEEEEVNPPRAI
ncbi:MAG: tetratricopeptide repeat protein, partial [Promethearchaeota archaeon]